MITIDDNELIKRIRSGDTDSLDLLIRRYMGLVRSQVRKSFLLGGDEEDLFQEGLIAILNAVKTFDSTKNKNFSSYVTVCIRSRIIDTIRTACRGKHQPLNNATSLSETNEIDLISNNANISDPLDLYLEKEWIDNFYDNIKAILSEEQIRILNLYFKGYTYKEISQRLDLSSKKVDNSLNSIKNKIRKERSKFL